MPLTKVVVSLPMDSGMPEDVSQQTFWFTCVSYPGDLTDAVASLEAFYVALGPYLSKDVDGVNVSWKAYNWEDPEPRLPVGDGNFTGVSPASNGIPPELAVCVSYHAAFESGEPNARRRGRFYFGPLGSVALSTSTPSHLSAGVSSDFATAAEALLDDSVAASGWRWVVYSRTDNVARDVVGGWVDNAWDVQRRRGVAADIRSTFTSP